MSASRHSVWHRAGVFWVLAACGWAFAPVSLITLTSHTANGWKRQSDEACKGPARHRAHAKGGAYHRLISRTAGNTGHMVDDTAQDRAIYHALKAADEVAAALQAHLIEEHGADPDRTVAQNPATNSLKLLRQARERLGEGLRAVAADTIAESDPISLRNQ